MTANEKTYIGDGVYLQFTGHDFVLTTEDGSDSATNTIYLDEDVAATLCQKLTTALYGEANDGTA